ncbi:MAG: ribonuclease E/G [Hyphomonadaceae bacterium]
MKAVLCIDEAVGERRRTLLDADGRPFRLAIDRWSERGRRARLDDVWWGRVKARMPGNRGWFVDLGLERYGIVEPTRAAIVTEGAMLAFRVKSEAWSDKGPALSLADISPTIAAPDKPQLHKEAAEDAFLKGAEVIETRTGLPARREIDAAIAEATTPIAPLPGAGDISIEMTRGLAVIDVDAGARLGSQDAAAFALDLNLAAALEAARQIGLRNLAGLLAIDFVRMESRRDQRTVAERFRQTLAEHLGRASEVLELSPLGVCEAAIARRAWPLAEAIAAAPAEREALNALREIETAGLTDRGVRIKARISAAAKHWLDADTIGWQAALGDRIGQRWLIEVSDNPLSRPEVWSAT